ncbi:16S rRNA (cytosine(967)-C(5))-methyltransferase [candidate division KSB3 bacterium]|uniref:16S rRNA (cytosine(967)-C(5))-methyltransferase n=1 Tax=candidate division KSB3 bacterium TaxID=2044937 RepID=A0A2G6E643_9BACT|nr:MAG: 16S rRNA (cytosine(967)-C(5))-methyltransferase [candidate division KSB3 bacterium]PIE30052.1 MAG: 16S rRNA (cytosine(967)-C(5))-methyltransferase [candidate division KSB3 bacterium]
MIASSREIALRVLCRVEGKQAYLGPALDAELQKVPELDRRDRGLAAELSYGVLRHRTRLDWYLDQLAKKPMQKANLYLRSLLRLGAYQLMLLDRIPASAAINESVDLAGKYSWKMKLPVRIAKGVVNGILRGLQRSEATLQKPESLSSVTARLAAVYSFPEWLVTRWVERLGRERATECCRINNLPSPLSLRVNSLKLSAEELREELRPQLDSLQRLPAPLHGFLISGAGPLRELSCLSNGSATVQNASSMLMPVLLDPQPGERVLDVCAGSGIKTTQIAELMRNQGRILAVDLYEAKLRRLHEQCERCGVSIAQSRCLDMTTVCGGADIDDTGGQGFDRVLVDAPCSGLGVLRQHPEAKWTRQERDIQALHELQFEILSRAARCLSSKGGVLVYSTCTTTPEENEKVLARFLQQMPNFSVEPVRDYLPDDLHNCLTPEGYLRIEPPRHCYDGFFCARLLSKQHNS